MDGKVKDIHITPTRRKRVDLTLPPILLETVDKIAQKQEKDRTAFIEDAIREKLNSLNVRIRGEIDYSDLTFEDLGFKNDHDCNIAIRRAQYKPTEERDEYIYR